jgi:hypothetical protein
MYKPNKAALIQQVAVRARAAHWSARGDGSSVVLAMGANHKEIGPA